MRLRVLAPLLLLLILPLVAMRVPEARAGQDRDAAVYYSGRGDKAFQAGDFDTAEQEYLRALDEDGTFLPARYGLAQTLLRIGETSEGVKELQRFVAEMKALDTAPGDWKVLQAKAQKQFASMDAAGAEIQKLVDRYADDLISLSKKWSSKDPDIAERAARRALRLRPGDTRAQELLAKVDAAPKGAPVVLFNGVDLKNWEEAELPFFKVEGGDIVVDVPIGSRQMRTAQSFSGDFDLSVEAKVIEDRAGGDPMLALLGTLNGTNDYVGVGLINHKVYFLDRRAASDKTILTKVPLAEWKFPFDPKEWNTYELRYREEEISAYINGNLVGSYERPETRHHGYAGLYGQYIRLLYRNVKLQRR